MAIEKLRPAFRFDEERIAPEAFVDERVNWETLKEALGEWVEEAG
jgi:hypothetical protein